MSLVVFIKGKKSIKPLIQITWGVSLYLVCFLTFANNIKAPPNISSEELQQYKGWLATFQQRSTDLPNSGTAEYVNELVGSNSPYLRQHAFNPINWKPWSDKVLKQAKRQNKLVLLSIGYSTCHWCHVMNKESFASLEVAEFVNANFLAIKVDRELSPDVDNYYMSVLEQIKGEAGWPITAIINSDGLPIFVESYLTKKGLLTLLKKVNQVWQQKPDFLIQSAQRIDQLVKQQTPIVDTEKLQIDYYAINEKLKSSLDRKYGGYIGLQKFPAEPMLAYALDQLTRVEDKSLEKLVKRQLKSMSQSGIRDHIFGGFHRYSTTQDWMVPHYEKMLYNQAQLTQIYTTAYLVFHDKSYLRVAEDTANAMLDIFLKPNSNKPKSVGFITALDADFKGQEGGYYLWDKTELESLVSDIDSQYLYSASAELYGILLDNISQEKDSVNVNQLRLKLQNYKRAMGELYLDSKVLTGWNGLAIKALVDLARVTDNGRYYQVASQVAKALWHERYKRSSGRLQRVEWDEKAESIYLDDYAFLGSAFISLYDVSGNRDWLERANELNKAANNFFVSSTGMINSSVAKTQLHNASNLSDGEVFTAVAIHLENSVKIAKRLEQPRVIKRLERQLNNLKSAVVKSPLEHLFAAKTLAEIYQSTRPIRFTSRGKAKVEFYCSEIGVGLCQTLQIEITVKEGWHLNSNKPLQSHLVATEIKQPKNWQVNYPKPVEKTLSFQAEKKSLYEGKFQIILQRSKGDNLRKIMQLPVQVCSDSICLLPEVFEFSM